MKEEYTPAEADILLLALPGLKVETNGMGGSTEKEPPTYDENGWG